MWDLVERWVDRRVRRSLDREVWSTRLAFVRVAWRQLVPVTLAFFAGAVLLMVVPMGRPDARYVAAGVLLATGVWAPYSVMIMRTYAVTVGSWAESWTRDVLRAKRLGWLVEEDLFLGGSNVDHIAITQQQVLVVESKYRGYSKRPDQARHDRDCAQVRTAAGRVHTVLKRAGVAVAPPLAVLVVWGPGGQHLPSLRDEVGVAVLAGEDLPSWCGRQANPRLVMLPDRDLVVAALTAQRQRHDEWRAKQAVPRAGARVVQPG